MTVTTRAIRYQAPASNTTQNYTVTDFGTPTAVMFIYSYGTTDETDTDHALIGYGFYDGTNDACVYGHSQDNYTTTGTAEGTYRVRSAVRDDAAVYYYDRNALTSRKATAAFITDGVQLTWTGTTTMQPYVTAILIKGATAAVGTLTTNANLDGTTAVSGLAFDPDLLFMSDSAHATINSDTGAHLVHWMGVAIKGNSPPTQRCLAQRDAANVATSAVTCGMFTTSASCYLPSSTYSGRTEFQVTSFDTGGFTVKTAITAVTARPMAYMALYTEATASLFDVATPSSAGDWSPTLSSVEPASVLMWTAGITTEDALTSTNPNCEGSGFWYANNSGEAYGHWITMEDDVATSNTKTVIGRKLSMIDASEGTPRTVLFQVDPGTSNANIDWTSTGFTIADANVSHGTSAYRIFGVAFPATVVISDLKLSVEPTTNPASKIYMTWET